MIEVVINKCFGGFGLSHEAILRYAELTNLNLKSEEGKWKDYEYYINGIEDNDHYFMDRDIKRDHPALVQVVRELGKRANGSCADLKIVEIPVDIDWYISEYDGNESIHETHRSWK